MGIKSPDIKLNWRKKIELYKLKFYFIMTQYNANASDWKFLMPSLLDKMK